MLARVLAMADDAEPNVRLQLALSLGQVPGAAADAALASILTRSGDNPLVRDAVISGLRGCELEFLSALLGDPNWLRPEAGKAAALGALARCVFNEKVAARVDRLLRLIASQSAEESWRKDAIVKALAEASAGRHRNNSQDAIVLAGPPQALDALSVSADSRTREQIQQISNDLDWPGKPKLEAPASKVQPLNTAQRALFEKGRGVFDQTCAACHQTTGLGQEGLAPPLVNSPWVLGSEQRLIRIALHGLEGSVSVNEKSYNLDMPPMGSLGDEELAAILTYIRHRWGNSAPPIEPARVTEIRRKTRNRAESWTATECASHSLIRSLPSFSRAST